MLVTTSVSCEAQTRPIKKHIVGYRGWREGLKLGFQSLGGQSWLSYCLPVCL